MFAILVPAALSPLIVTLAWAERKAKKLGLVPAPAPAPEVERTINARVVRPAWTFAQQLDLVGLLLIGASTALILLPLTLAEGAKGGWHNGTCTPWFRHCGAGLIRICSVDDCHARRRHHSHSRCCVLGGWVREAPRSC